MRHSNSNITRRSNTTTSNPPLTRNKASTHPNKQRIQKQERKHRRKPKESLESIIRSYVSTLVWYLVSSTDTKTDHYFQNQNRHHQQQRQTNVPGNTTSNNRHSILRLIHRMKHIHRCYRFICYTVAIISCSFIFHVYLPKQKQQQQHTPPQMNLMEEIELEYHTIILYPYQEGETYKNDDYVVEKEEEVDFYFAFDDDYFRNSYMAYEDDAYLNGGGICRRVSWYRDQYPTCNKVHEVDPMGGDITYIASGGFNDVFTLSHTYPQNTASTSITTMMNDSLIGKQILYKYNSKDNYDCYEDVRKDALFFERLTFSPRVVDIYAYCGLVTYSEKMNGGDLEDLAVPTSGYKSEENFEEEDFDLENAAHHNDFAPAEKLILAKEMAEALSELHGYEYGVMFHGDVQLTQFLYPDKERKGRIKLNDFNRGEILLYNEEKGEYCRHMERDAAGSYRPPEEYAYKPINEQVDVYSFGNNIYALLTGLWPDFQFDDDNIKNFQEKIIDGYQPPIPEGYAKRSYAEEKLVELLEKCWEYDPNDRITIFEATRFLREACVTQEQERLDDAYSNDGNEEFLE